ncbi:MAG: CAP domain-containing protein [Robiginitalea sp.]|nr:CAP domain-containing protein [Robiginitalea sp.]
MKMKLQQALMVLFVGLALSCSKEPADPAVIPVAENVPAVESELLELVNAHRTSLGYNPLSFSQLAYEYANEHTDYMVSTGTISHYNFSARASSIAKAANAQAVAENLARDYPSAEKALEGWLASDSHRKTMEGEFSHTAISVKKDPNGTLYFTQLFYLK